MLNRPNASVNEPLVSRNCPKDGVFGMLIVTTLVVLPQALLNERIRMNAELRRRTDLVVNRLIQLRDSL